MHSRMPSSYSGQDSVTPNEGIDLPLPQEENGRERSEEMEDEK